MRKIIFNVTLDNDDWTDDQYNNQEELEIEVDEDTLREFVAEQAARQGKLLKGCFISELSYSIKNYYG